MTDTLSERLRKAEASSHLPDDGLCGEAADALDAKDAEIARLHEALNVDAKVLEDLDRATRNRGARVAT